MSDNNSSVVSTHHDQSVSTDSEESFLVKQINKSSLFNSSSSSSNSSKKRKSFFRESYIDDTGIDRSFSVFQDVILENTDESRDISNISKLSSLDVDKFKKVNNSRGSILAELSLNDQLPNLSRKSSKRRSKYENKVPPSQRSSFINDSSQEPPTVKTPTIPSQPRDAITDIIAVYKDEPDQKSKEASEIINLPLQKPFNLKPNTDSSSRSSSKSYQSAKSELSTRRSLLNFEMTRKKQLGTPHLLLHSSPSTQNSSEKRSIPSIPVPNFIKTPSADSVHLIDQLKTNIPIKKGPDILATLKLENYDENDSDSENSLNLINKEKKKILLENNDNGNYYNDDLLEKIYYYRRIPDIPNDSNHSQKLIWCIYFIAFLVPPLFFFLGLGLLDRYLLNYKINPGLKRLSLITGIIILIISFAMIGVGFGYGIHAASM